MLVHVHNKHIPKRGDLCLTIFLGGVGADHRHPKGKTKTARAQNKKNVEQSVNLPGNRIHSSEGIQQGVLQQGQWGDFKD